MWYYIAASFGACVGFMAFACLSIYRENREIRRLRAALDEIIVESGKVDIVNWPMTQQICQSIAFYALHRKVKGE